MNNSRIYRQRRRRAVGGTTRIKKYKTYLFHCPENNRAYRLLASRKWQKGDILVLPPIRVRAEPSLLYGNEYSLYLAKMPTIYAFSGYLPKAGYSIKYLGDRRWRLTQI